MKLKLRGFLIGSAALLALSPWHRPASAQSQDDTSVAAAARKARELKKNAAKPAPTLTNDDLPAATPAGGRPAAAQAEQAAGDETKPAESALAPAGGKSADATADQEKRAQKKSDAEAALKQAKADLAQSEGELNVLKRKQTLDSDSYYSKTDYLQDTEGQAALDADAREISGKKSQVEALKTKIAELQAEIEQYSEPQKAATEQPN